MFASAAAYNEPRIPAWITRAGRECDTPGASLASVESIAGRAMVAGAAVLGAVAVALWW